MVFVLKRAMLKNTGEVKCGVNRLRKGGCGDEKISRAESLGDIRLRKENHSPGDGIDKRLFGQRAW